MNEKTPMIMQIESIPDLIESLQEPLTAEAERVMSVCGCKQFEHIVITGCGDSYCSALAAKFAFLNFTDSHIEVVSAVDLSRYYTDKRIQAEHTVFVIVSNSGRVTRLIEACKRIRQLGGIVLAVTGNSESDLYKHASEALKIEVPKFVYAPGIRSYCGCLMALLALAVAIGTAQKGSRSYFREKLKQEVFTLARNTQKMLPIWEKQISALQNLFTDAGCYDLTGSGSNYATAQFGAAKAFETTGKPALVSNSEDWFHMNFFVKDIDHTPVILFSNRADGDHSRSRELVDIAEKMGRTVLCITDDENLECSHRILTPETDHVELQTLIQYLPMSLLFSQLCDADGETYFRGGLGRWSACLDCATLIDSEERIVRIPEENN